VVDWGSGRLKGASRGEDDGQEAAVEGKVGSGAAPDRQGTMRWAGGCEGERRLTGMSLPRRQLIMHLTSNAFHPSKARAMLGHGAPTPKGG
jgi:hypothetical protein